MLKGPIARATIRTSFVLGLRLVVQAGTLLLVARMLGPEQFGAYAGVAALAVLMGAFSTFGTHLVLLGEVAKQAVRRNQILTYAAPTALLCGTALFFIFVLICINVFNIKQVPINVIVCIGLAEFVFLPLFTLPATEQLGLGKTARSQLLSTMPLALRTLWAGAVLLIAPSNPLALFSYGYLITAVLAIVFVGWYIPSAWGAVSQWRLPTAPQLRHSAGYAAIALTNIAPSELDKALAAKLLPLGAAGLYAASTRAVAAVTLPVMAMMLAALPRLFRDSEASSNQSKRFLRWLFIAGSLYGLMIVAVLWLVAPLFEQLFGSKYEGISDTLRWLCLAAPALGLRMAAGNTLMALGKPWLRTGFELVGILALVITAIFFTQIYGTTGMSVALISAEWSMAAIGWGLIYLNANKNIIT